MNDLDAYFTGRDAASIDELTQLLRIPSISSLPDHAAHVTAAAEWAAARCEAAGFSKVEILPTAGHPAVYAERLDAPGAPTVLVYGHVDVQPVDPLNEWTRNPFEPWVRGEGDDAVIVARGANDDKGNLLAPILAVEALLQRDGTLPVNVKLLLEGEEEIGSPHLLALLQAERERLAADLVISADGGGLACDGTAPVLMTGYRGLTALEIAVEGPTADLHSGAYGGVVENPLKAMSHLLATLHDEEGRVAVAGFYDDVVPPLDEERQMLAASPFDEAGLTGRLGVDTLTGEPGFTPRERLWIRPTLEINGLWGGFQDEGIKTVIPRVAHAKISCRLVPGQEPEAIQTALEAHLRQHLPKGVRLRVTDREQGARPYVLSPDHPGVQAARAVATDLCGEVPWFARSGGTLPVCDLLLQTLGTFTVTFAAAAYDEAAHGPDEFFRLASFRRMQRGYAALLPHLARTLTPRT